MGGNADGLHGQTSGSQAWDDRAANGLSNGASTSGGPLMLTPLYLSPPPPPQPLQQAVC